MCLYNFARDRIQTYTDLFFHVMHAAGIYAKAAENTADKGAGVKMHLGKIPYIHAGPLLGYQEA